MKTIIKLILIFLMLNSGQSYTQNLLSKKKWHTGVSLGLDLNQMLERSVTKAIHKGPGLSLGIFSEKLIGRSLQRVELVFSSHFMKSRIEDEISSYHFTGSLRFRQLFNICDPEECQSFFIGASASLDVGVTYFDNWDENHFYWSTNYSLGLDSRIQKRLGKNKIQLEAGFPIISLVSRPPESFSYSQSSSDFMSVLKNIHENPRLLSPFKHFTGNLLLRYCFEGNSRFRKNIFWQTSYLSNHLPESGKLNVLTNRFGLELYL